MKIIFYKCTSENNRIDKTGFLQTVLNTSGNYKQKDVSVMNPTFAVKYRSSLLSSNYCYIPELNRYYYIDSFSNITNDILEVSCHVDVLMTYKKEFLQNEGYVETSENYGNFYLNDENMPVQQNTKIPLVKNFTSPFSDRNSSIVMNALGLAASYQFNEEEE